MERKKKKRLKFDLDELFEGKAWLVNELAEKANVPDYKMRTYLRVLWTLGKLQRIRVGRYYYYFTTTDFEKVKRRLKKL